MRFWPFALAAAFVLSACGTSGGSRGSSSNGDPIRALLSTDVLLFSDFDADSDYVVTTAEIETGATSEFARADVNRDGALGPIEFQTWANQVLGGTMTPPYRLDFDRNVDNVISAEEFRNELVARGQTYDSDESGSITRAEFVRQLNQARPVARRPTPGEPPGPGGGPIDRN
ncbi:MAG: hypothetical protein NW206_05885 [Hyphomonadaceae bacterium]|nr:hypothetical protein [Hyphomonadaceae bacterium]